MATTAIVFVLSEHLYPHASICYQYCLSLGYHAVGIVRDDWSKAWDYIRDGKAEVIVVASPKDLNPERSPRVEIVSHQRRHHDVVKPSRPGKGERTRIIRRNAGE